MESDKARKMLLIEKKTVKKYMPRSGQKIDFMIFLPLFHLYFKNVHEYWKSETLDKKSIQFYLETTANFEKNISAGVKIFGFKKTENSIFLLF